MTFRPVDKLVRKGDPYIANEDLNHLFDQHDVNIVVDRWNQGEDLEDIAADLKRDPDEVFILLFDLGRKGKIKRKFAKRLRR